MGDRPLIQLTLAVDGKQVAWNNAYAPVTVSMPYTPTAAERANPENIVYGYIDGSGKVVSAPNGHYDLAIGSTYFNGYLTAAKRLGISGGIGSNMFAPDKEITRQEMFTLLSNALKVINKLPQGNLDNSLSNFSDAEQISSRVKNAMTLLLETGTVGGNDGKLTPTNATTRGEMAQVLYNLLSK